MLRNLGTLFDHGRLAGTGYVSILPVDQGIEHSAAASFAKNPAYFDPKNIVELAIEGGCNAVATTLGVLGVGRRAQYAHQIPFIVKLNHNELLTYPNKFDQIMFGSRASRRYDLGAVGVGATIYFGSDESTRQIQEVARGLRRRRTSSGMFTVLWCYLRNTAFKKDGVDYHVSADLTGQANHLGVTIEADIIKQKLPENNGGYNALRLRQDRQARLRRAHHRPPDRPHPLAGRRTATWAASGSSTRGGASKGDERPRRGRAHGGDQQARRRHGADRRPQGVPAPDAAGTN